MMSCVPEDVDVAKTSSSHHKKVRELQAQISHSTIDWKDGLRVVLGHVQILSIFGLVAVTGYSLGFLENFCYINIRELYKQHGQTDVAARDVSLCRLFYSFGGVLSWWYSGSWNSRLGADVVMWTAVGCLPLCFFLYAGIGSGLDRWTKFGFFLSESLRSGIFAALWSTATVRLNKLSPSHMKTMMVRLIIACGRYLRYYRFNIVASLLWNDQQSLMESTYRGVGHTSGSYFGGILCKKYDDMPTAFIVSGKSLLSFLCIVGTICFMSPKK